MGFWNRMSNRQKIAAALIELPILLYFIFSLRLNAIQLIFVGLPIVLIIDILVLKISKIFSNNKNRESSN